MTLRPASNASTLPGAISSLSSPGSGNSTDAPSRNSAYTEASVISVWHTTVNQAPNSGKAMAVLHANTRSRRAPSAARARHTSRPTSSTVSTSRHQKMRSCAGCCSHWPVDQVTRSISQNSIRLHTTTAQAARTPRSALTRKACTANSSRHLASMRPTPSTRRRTRTNPPITSDALPAPRDVPAYDRAGTPDSARPHAAEWARSGSIHCIRHVVRTV